MDASTVRESIFAQGTIEPRLEFELLRSSVPPLLSSLSRSTLLEACLRSGTVKSVSGEKDARNASLSLFCRGVECLSRRRSRAVFVDGISQLAYTDCRDCLDMPREFRQYQSESTTDERFEHSKPVEIQSLKTRRASTNTCCELPVNDPGGSQEKHSNRRTWSVRNRK